VRMTSARIWRTTATMLVVALFIAACGGGAGASSDTGSKDPVRISVNPWTGSRANAAVIEYLLKEKLGYPVELKNLDEGVDWQGFETGELDAILEVWGHDAERKTYIDEKKVAQDAGQMGVKGTIGWYVPGWMAKDHPDITDWNNLNNYADLFKTSESGDKGQFLLGDPSYVSNDEALIKNLGLDFKVVTGGSEAALIESLKQATTQKTPLLAYFYDPQWAWSQEPLKSDPLVRINLPPADGADCVDVATDPEGANCDYPAYDLYKAVSTDFAQNGGAAYDLIKNFTWTNLDQSTMAELIDNQGMTPEDAAAKWVADNEAIWSKWMPAQ
jgi:glycine betaine/proline transport system substrate-binding protein